MAINRGKDFEKVIKESFEQVPDVSVDRLHDQTTGFAGSFNICDFIVYHKPNIYYIECKSVHGNTLPLSNITDRQYKGLLEKSNIEGVIAGVICWWIDKDVTRFISAEELKMCKQTGYKSIRFDHEPFTVNGFIEIKGTKKRVFFDYDMYTFFSVTRVIDEMNMKSKLL